MILDINMFRNKGNLDILKSLQARYGKIRSVSYVVGEAASATNVPVTVMYCFYGELYGFNLDVMEGLESCKKFYQVTEIVGIQY